MHSPSSLRPRVWHKYMRLGSALLCLSFERTSPHCAYLIGSKNRDSCNFRNWLPVALIWSISRCKSVDYRIVPLAVYGLGLGIIWKRSTT